MSRATAAPACCALLVSPWGFDWEERVAQAMRLKAGRLFTGSSSRKEALELLADMCQLDPRAVLASSFRSWP